MTSYLQTLPLTKLKETRTKYPEPRAFKNLLPQHVRPSVQDLAIKISSHEATFDVETSNLNGKRLCSAAAADHGNRAPTRLLETLEREEHGAGT